MKNKKKGFTLVELIVVLAILAILAAMLVPALTGYIDKANEKKINSLTRQVVVAAQTVVSEKYASNSNFKAGNVSAYDTKFGTSFEMDNANQFNIGEICKLAEVATNLTVTKDQDYTWVNNEGQTWTFVADVYRGNLIKGLSFIGISYDEKAKITKVILKKDGKTCIYDGSTGEYTIS